MQTTTTHLTLELPSDMTIPEPEPQSSSASSILRYLTQLDTNSEQFPVTLNSMLHSDDFSDFVSSLRDDEVIVFIDFLDRALDSALVDDELSRKCLRCLRKICGQTGQLPNSYIISEGLVKTNDIAFASGGFADVWTGSYQELQVAIKSLRTYAVDDEESVRKRFCKEVVIWKRLSHPNVLRFLGVSTTIFSLCMVSEWMPHGNIVQYLKSCPDKNRLELLLDVAKGLEYLHSRQVVHGDLKGPNIVIDERGGARLADFGLASITSDSMSLNASTPGNTDGTVRWMAPELLNPPVHSPGPDSDVSRPTKASDIYAMAMVVIEVFSGHAPFHEYRKEIAIIRILKGIRPNRPEKTLALGLSDDVWEVVQQCWQEESDRRPHVSDIVNCFARAVSVLTLSSVREVAPSIQHVDYNQTSTTTFLRETIQSSPHRFNTPSANESIPPHLNGFERISQKGPYLPSRTPPDEPTAGSAAPPQQEQTPKHEATIRNDPTPPSRKSSRREPNPSGPQLVAPTQEATKPPPPPIPQQPYVCETDPQSQHPLSILKQERDATPSSKEPLQPESNPPCSTPEHEHVPRHTPPLPSRKPSRREQNPTALKQESIQHTPARQPSHRELSQHPSVTPRSESIPLILPHTPHPPSRQPSRRELNPPSRQNSNTSQRSSTALHHVPPPPSRQPSRRGLNTPSQLPPVTLKREHSQRLHHDPTSLFRQPSRHGSNPPSKDTPAAPKKEPAPQHVSPTPSRKHSRRELSSTAPEKEPTLPHTPSRQPSQRESSRPSLATSQPELTPQRIPPPLSRQPPERPPSAPQKSPLPPSRQPSCKNSRTALQLEPNVQIPQHNLPQISAQESVTPKSSKGETVGEKEGKSPSSCCCVIQ